MSHRARDSYIRATEQNEEGEETSSMASGSDQEDSMVLGEEVKKLKESLSAERLKNCDANLPTIGAKIPEVSLVSPLMTMKTRKLLKGHQSRIVSFDWSPDKRHLVSGGQDGYAIVWDAFTAQKELLIETDCEWILTCAYSPSTTLAACGGMNNQCSVYKLDDPRPPGEGKITSPLRVAANHTRYITGCAFFGSDQQLLTSSADSTCALWDLERDDPVQEFKGHQLEVTSLAVNSFNPFSLFASCGSDQCVRLWDPRSNQCVQKFSNLGGTINSLVFFPSGDFVAAAVDDGTVHLFDLRADQEVMVYSKPSILFGASSVDFSLSGRLLFVGYNDHTVRSWDVIKGEQLGAWFDHQDRVSHVKLSPDGMALGSCSWDATIRIWA